MKKLLCFILTILQLLFIIPIHLQAQDPNLIPDVYNATIPSPEAVSLDKLMTQQVDLYTGKPNFEIPLFIAKSRKLYMPIKLTYNNNGLVVPEYPSWVGHGWSLSAGGQISRQVRCMPDETSSNGYFTRGSMLPSDPETIYKTDYFTQGQKILIANQTMDLEPDIFNYSIPGYSGQFVIYVDPSGNKTVLTIPYQNLNITYSPDLTSFTIITEDGTNYFFGGNAQFLENQSHDAVCPESGWGKSYQFNSRWLLSKIRSADHGDSITFNYSSYNVPEHLEYPSTQSISVALDFGQCESYDCGLQHSFWTYYQTSDDIDARYISDIYTANEHYMFTNQDRVDLPGGKMLVSIEQRNNEMVLKKLRFFSSYGGHLLTSGQCRLFLDSISEFNSINIQEKPPYKFFYKNRDRVPPFESYSQDYWGYFNGQTNASLVPSINYDNIIHLGNANRSIDTTLCSIGILQQINFPTGGYTKINYEPNTYSYINGYYVNKHYHVSSGTCHVLADTCEMGDKKNSYDSSSFSISYDQYIHLQGELKRCWNGDFVGSLTIYDSLHVPVWSKLEFYGNANPTDFNDSIYFHKGHYSVVAQVENWDKAWLTVGYRNIYEISDSIPAPDYSYCGGVRVKSIVTNDGINSRNEIWKTYNYDEIHGEGKSSGRLLADIPRFDHIDHRGCCIPNYSAAGCLKTYLTVSSNPCDLLSYFSGDIVCYSNVTEFLGKNGEFGQNIYYYSFVHDFTTLNYPPAPPASQRWHRGVLYRKESYDSVGNLKYKELYSEKFSDSTISGPHFKRILGVTGTWFQTGDCVPQIPIIQPYEIRTDWHHPNRKMLITYGVPGQDSVLIDEKYYYENPDHAQQTKTIVNNSNGDLLITRFVYPKDIGLTSINWGDLFQQAIFHMVYDYHIENAVLEQTNFLQKNNSIYLLGSKVTYYKPFSIGSSLYRILPDKEYLLRLENPISASNFSRIGLNDNKIVIDSKYDHAPELVYEKYDVNGNVIQFKPRTSPRVSFLFGYNGQFPLAKAINAVATDISYDPGSGQITVPNTAFLTTYTFHPVYGMTSETDPNGISTYYEYDDSGRLKFIKDTNHNILKRFLYHYAPGGHSK